MFCYGKGEIDGARTVPTLVPTAGALSPSKKARKGQNRLSRSPITTVPKTTPAPVKKNGVGSNSTSGSTETRCPECKIAVKHLKRHINKVHKKKNKAQKKKLLVANHAADAEHKKKTAVPERQLKNEVLQEKLSRALDATRDYAHSYREHGRYGSHSSHDDFD